MRQLFAIGQAVTLIKTQSTYEVQAGSHLTGVTHSYGPKPGEIVHVSRFEEEAGEGWITFKEYPPNCGNTHWYFQDEFAPVVSTTVLQKELSEIFSEEIAGVK